jgi:hypothetical protein
VHHDPSAPLEKLDEYFKMKEGSIQVPNFYLGEKLEKTVLPNYVVAWSMSSIKYVHVKLLPLPQPPVRARTDARTNPSAQRATQLRSVLARVYAVSIQNQITTSVP